MAEYITSKYVCTYIPVWISIFYANKLTIYVNFELIKEPFLWLYFVKNVWLH